MTEYVGWLGLDRSSLDEKDVLSGGVERLHLGTPGFLTKAEGSTTQVTPIVVTSPQAMQIAAEKFAGMPDPVALLRAYKPEGKPLTLAARVSGTANSAFPEGAPKPKKEEPEKKEGDDKAKADGAKDAKEEPAKEAKDTTEARPKGDKPKDDKPKEEKAEAAPPAKPHVASGKVNVIVVADADLLQRSVLGRRARLHGPAGGDSQCQQCRLRGQRARQPLGLGGADRASRARRRGPPVQARQ